MIQCARLTFGLSAAFDDGHQIEDLPVTVDMEPMQRQVAPPPSKRAPSPRERQAEAGKEKPEKSEKPQEAHDPRTGELFEVEEYLTDLDTSLATAKNVQEIAAIFSDFDVQTTLHSFPDHFQRAKDLMAWHEKRLKATSD